MFTLSDISFFPLAHVQILQGLVYEEDKKNHREGGVKPQLCVYAITGNKKACDC